MAQDWARSKASPLCLSLRFLQLTRILEAKLGHLERLGRGFHPSRWIASTQRWCLTRARASHARSVGTAVPLRAPLACGRAPSLPCPLRPPGATEVPWGPAALPPPTLALCRLLSPRPLLLGHSCLRFSLLQALLFLQTSCPCGPFDSEPGLSGRVWADSANPTPGAIAPRSPPLSAPTPISGCSRKAHSRTAPVLAPGGARSSPLFSPQPEVDSDPPVTGARRP